MVELESARILEKKGVDFRLIELENRAVSVEDVIKYSKKEIKPEEICKTIIVKDNKNAKYAIFLLGDQKIDFKKAKTILGSKVRISSLQEVKETTGVEPGAVCPLLVNIPLLVDTKILTRERINFGSGNHRYGLEIRPKDLAKIKDYTPVDITQS